METGVSKSAHSGPATGAAGTGSALPVLPPSSAFFELAVLILGILAVDWLVPDQGVAEIGTSPYWLPVLLLSLQYGTVSGLMAAAVGIIMTLMAGVPEQGVGENHFAYLLRIWAQPILWIGVAVLLGQFRMRQIAVKSELIREVQELGSQRQALADYSLNLRARCEDLERDIAGRRDLPALPLLAALAELGRTDSDLAAALSRIVALSMPGAEASVFAVSDGRLKRVADSGWRADRTWAEEMTAVHPLFRAVIDRGQCVGVLDADGEAILAGEGLAAVPIRSGQGGRVVGMVKLETAPASALSAETSAALQSIAAALSWRLMQQGEWVGTAEPTSARTAEVVAAPGHLRRSFGRAVGWVRGQPLEADAGSGGEAAEPVAGVRPRIVH